MSIIFGTLTAATVSDASSRLALLRSLAVDEVTLMLPLTRRLIIEAKHEASSSSSYISPSSPPSKRVALLNDALRLLWDHTTMLIRGSREEELLSIANGDDALLNCVELMHPAVVVDEEGRGDEGGGPGGRDLSFAMDGLNDIIKARGRRLSLENAGIPDLQLASLRTLKFTLLLVFAYLSKGVVTSPPSSIIGLRAKLLVIVTVSEDSH